MSLLMGSPGVGMKSSYTPQLPSDANYADVTLLCHFDGVDASTTITDDSPDAITLTATGSAEIDTAQSKFGGSSLNPNGSQVESTATTGFDFGSGDFTVESFIRPSSLSGGGAACALWTTGDLSWYFARATAALVFYYHDGSSAIFDVTGGTLTINTWQHVAVCRDGNTLRLFIDGSVVHTKDVTGLTIRSPTSVKFTLGAHATDANVLAGHTDETRITKGVARYTGAFTPPASQFPDRAP